MKPRPTPAVVPPPTLPVSLQVGHYAVGSSGSLVRLDERTEHGTWWISYVGITPSTGRIYNGGSSGWWPDSEFKPVTGAAHALAIRAHRAMLRETEMTEALELAKRDQLICAEAILALRNANGVA